MRCRVAHIPHQREYWHTHLGHTTDDALQRLWIDIIERQRDATAGQGTPQCDAPSDPSRNNALPGEIDR